MIKYNLKFKHKNAFAKQIFNLPNFIDLIFCFLFSVIFSPSFDPLTCGYRSTICITKLFCVKPIKWFFSSGLRWKFRWWLTARISFGISWNASIEISPKLEFAGKCGCAVNISISTQFPLLNGFELKLICVECISLCVCYIIVLLSPSGLSNRIHFSSSADVEYWKNFV